MADNKPFDQNAFVKAMTEAQQARNTQTLPGYQQPVNPANFNPQDDAIEPSVDLMDVAAVAAPVAKVAAKGIAKVGRAAAPYARQLMADEAGMARLPKAAAPSPAMMELEHYSHVPDLMEIDASKMGSGIDKFTKGRSYSNPVSFHYLKGTAPEQQSALAQSPHKYSSSVDPSKLYDLSTDPTGIAAKVIEQNNGAMNMDAITSAVKDSGYAGYRVTGHPDEGLAKSVMLFDKVKTHTPHKEASAEEFHKAVSSAMGKDKKIKEALSLYSPEEYKGMKTYISPDKKSGYAIKSDGELVSVFSLEKGRGNGIVSQAKDQGATKLDAFDNGYLPEFYSKHGFKETARSANWTPGGDDVVNMEIPEKKKGYAGGGMISDEPEGLDAFLAEPTPSAEAAAPTANAEPAGLNEFLAPELKHEKYGTTVQMIKTGLEGLAQGVAGPLATAAERGLGVDPEDIRGREEVNPGIHLATEVAGFVGPALLTGGATAAGRTGVAGAAKTASAFTQAGLLTKAGEAVAGATGLGKAGSGFVSQVGADAIKGAFEAALYQSGAEVSKVFKEDPEQSAGSAIADIGLAGVMGGVFGGAIGAALRKTGLHAEVPQEAPGKFVSEIDRPLIDAGDFKATVEHSGAFKPKDSEGIIAGLAKRKANASEIESAANRRGYTVLEGMVSDHPLVQRAEDSLINGAPTYSGLRRKQLYNDAYAKAAGDVDATLGEGSKLSKAEIGDQFKQTLTAQIKEENEPIKAMYDYLKQHNENIPLSLNTGKIIQEIESMPEFRLTGNLPGGNLLKGALEGISKSQTVDDIKVIRSSIGGALGPTAAPNERRVASIITDKLKQLEEDSIETFARISAKTPEEKAIALGLNAARKEADAAYKPFIQKLQKLSKALGKENIGGAQGAVQFINNLTPEQVTQRLFTKNNSQFLKFFEKEFPEQAAQMRAYQRGVLREAATKEDALSAKDLFNKINKLEPEVQQALFSKAELSQLRDAETYIRSFPKNFNPSGTAHTDAFRAFFHSPSGAALSNVRDFAIEKFITTAGASAVKIEQAVQLAKATVAGEKAATRGVKAIFGRAADTVPASAGNIIAQRAKLDRLIDSYHADPSKMFSQNDSNPIPEYSQAFAAASSRAVQYLGSMKPDTAPKNPLDPKLPANPMEKAAYNRALDITQQPLSVLAKIKAGTLTQQDVIALKTVYPSVYKNLSQKILSEVVETQRKGHTVPYKTRMQLSLFLGQPMDSTMTQQAMQAIQMQAQSTKQQAQQQQIQSAPPANKAAGLDKIAEQSQTARQGREAARAKRDN